MLHKDIKIEHSCIVLIRAYRGQHIKGKQIKIPKKSKWNGTFFTFPLIIEGTTEKVLQFKMPVKSIYDKNLDFIKQKM
jgi:hypothetical protein